MEAGSHGLLWFQIKIFAIKQTKRRIRARAERDSRREELSAIV